MKITNSQLRKLIKEQIQSIFEDENQLTSVDTEVNTDYSQLSQYLTNLGKKFPEEVKNKLNSSISTILKTGRGFITHEKSLQKSIKNDSAYSVSTEFNYIVSALATIYKDVSDSEKRNIKNYFFLAYNPYASTGEGVEVKTKPSPIAIIIGKATGITHELTFIKNIDVQYYLEFISNAIYDAIPRSLENYNSEKGSFHSLFVTIASNLGKDFLKTPGAKTMFTGFDIKHSGDTPKYEERPSETDVVRSSEDIEGDERAAPKTEKERLGEEKELAVAISKFVKEKLQKYPKMIEFFELFAEQGKTMSEIAIETNTEENNLRQYKMRLEHILDQYVKNGSFYNYIEKVTGQEIRLPGNTFKLYKVKDIAQDVEELMEVVRTIRKVISESFSKLQKS